MITSTAFEKLFRTEYVRLYRLAYSLLHDRQESEDAVSEVFAILWKTQPEVGNDKLPDYLARAVHNHCMNLLSRQASFENLKDSYRQEQLFVQKKDLAEQERLIQIRQYIDHSMPPRTREVFGLCYGQGMSYQQAADSLQVSIAAINKHIVVGLRMLRERFAKGR